MYAELDSVAFDTGRDIFGYYESFDIVVLSTDWNNDDGLFVRQNLFTK